MSPEGHRVDRAALAARIPGVRLGFGVPIEAATEARAARIRLLSREARSDLIVIDVSKYKDFMWSAKALNSDEPLRARWLPRYNPTTGAIYIPRWDTPLTTITSKNKQRLVTGEKVNYWVLKKPDSIGIKKIDLNAMPLSWSVGRLIPQELQSIEDALRQQDEVSHDYNIDGPEFARVEEVLSLIRILSIEFIHKHPKLEVDYEDLRDQVGEVFTHHGLEYAASPIWQRVEDKIRMAVQKDKLGRNNPSASRFILASAVLNTVTMEVVAGLTREKSRNIYSHLVKEREIERSHLLWASDNLVRAKTKVEKFIGVDPKRITNDRIHSFRNGLKATDMILSSVRVSPYLQAATVSRVFLASATLRTSAESWRISNRLMACGLVGLVESLKEVSAEDYMMKRDVIGVMRVLQRTNDFINLCLSDPQNLDIKVFDH